MLLALALDSTSRSFFVLDALLAPPLLPLRLLLGLDGLGLALARGGGRGALARALAPLRLGFRLSGLGGRRRCRLLALLLRRLALALRPGPGTSRRLGSRRRRRWLLRAAPRSTTLRVRTPRLPGRALRVHRVLVAPQCYQSYERPVSSTYNIKFMMNKLCVTRDTRAHWRWGQREDGKIPGSIHPRLTIIGPSPVHRAEV